MVVQRNRAHSIPESECFHRLGIRCTENREFKFLSFRRAISRSCTPYAEEVELVSNGDCDELREGVVGEEKNALGCWEP